MREKTGFKVIVWLAGNFGIWEAASNRCWVVTKQDQVGRKEATRGFHKGTVGGVVDQPLGVDVL